MIARGMRKSAVADYNGYRGQTCGVVPLQFGFVGRGAGLESFLMFDDI